jgi:hypothetical protein
MHLGFLSEPAHFHRSTHATISEALRSRAKACWAARRMQGLQRRLQKLENITLVQRMPVHFKIPAGAVFIVSIVAVVSVWAGFSVAAGGDSETAQSPTVRDGSHDFDFVYGKWRMPNHRLTKRLAGSHQWADFITCDEGSPARRDWRY